MGRDTNLEKILDSTPFLLARCSLDFRYVYVSKAYATMLGRSPDEFSGKPIIDIMGPKGFETIRPYVEIALRGERVEYEREVHYANVGPRQLHVIYVPERDEQSQVVGWIASIIDITEKRKETEERERLENVLQHATRLAALNALSAGIVHQISQPLTAILSNAQAAERLLKGNPIDVIELGKAIRAIIEDDTSAGQTINGLRQLLKKEEHKTTLIDLNDLVGSTLQLLKSEMVNSGIRVETELETDLPPISGDPVQLQQVLLNLMLNGMEAMASTPPERRRLTIVTRTTEKRSVELLIRDYGSGMSAEQLKRIYEPFFTTKEHALGLGLSISLTIVRLHRGQLNVSNASGGGTEAVISLPLRA